MNKNTERFLYNNQNVNRKALEKAYEESAYYDVVYAGIFYDCVYKIPQVSGSCVLVKFKKRFFIVTAQHTLKYVPESVNVRPVLKSTYQKKKISPSQARLWLYERDYQMELSDKVLSSDAAEFPTDFDDISIREVILDSELDAGFIDLDNEQVVSCIKKLPGLKGDELVLVEGYPSKHIDIDFEENGNLKDFKVVLVSNIGEATIQGEEEIVSFKNNYENILAHEDLNGVSGGIILSLSYFPEYICWVGMVVRAGNSIVHYVLAKDIIRLLEAICCFPDESSKQIK